MDTTGTTWLPPQSSTIASDVDALWNFIFWSSTTFFVLLGAVIIFLAVRYRRRKQGELTTSKDHSLGMEILWTAIPTVLVFIIFVWGFKTFLRMQIVPGDAIEVKVTGQKWFWTFDYAEGANTVNELVVPVDKPVKLLMSSSDVIHSFFVPNFRMKMDVVPNRYTVSWFESTQLGEFDLLCTEFCGTGHSQMIGKVRVVSEREFNEWLESSSGMGEGIPMEDYGAELYKKKACVTCHSVDGSKVVGPSFLGRFGNPIVLQSGEQITMDENYIRESILNPQAKIAGGYEPVMPTYQGVLKDRQIDALIAYIKSLQK